MSSVDFLSLLDYVCGNELLLRQQDEFLFYRMTLLPRFLLTTPTNLWSRCERVKACLTICPTCGHEYKAVAATAAASSSSFANTHNHSNNCVYQQLCLPRNYHQEKGIVRKFLRQRWHQTKTEVALEMGFHPSHIISAYMHRFPNNNHPNYRHAGELVEVLLDLEETKSPSWDVTELMAWFLLAPDISTLPPPPSSSSVKRRSTKTTTHLQQRLFDSIMPPGATAAATSTTTTKDDLVNETLRLVAMVRCKICFYQEANILTLHCGHVFLCTDCSQRQKQCPVCREHIVSKIKVYRG